MFVQILTLKRPIEFSWKVRPACLPSDPSVSYEGELAEATGWGRTDTGYSATNLMEVDVKVIDTETCSNLSCCIDEFVSNPLIELILFIVCSSIHICATGVGASDFGTRGGDSGSPLNYPDVNGR